MIQCVFQSSFNVVQEKSSAVSVDDRMHSGKVNPYLKPKEKEAMLCLGPQVKSHNSNTSKIQLRDKRPLVRTSSTLRIQDTNAFEQNFRENDIEYN